MKPESVVSIREIVSEESESIACIREVTSDECGSTCTAIMLMRMMARKASIIHFDSFMTVVLISILFY